MPVTVFCISEGLKKLRQAGFYQPDAMQTVKLWRGIKNIKMGEEFLCSGGAEPAPMSTTKSLQTAVEYSSSETPVLMRIWSEGWLMRGADVAFLSAFPSEKEMLFPPLTYLIPKYPGTKPMEVVVKGHRTRTYHILDVIAQLPAS
uniref:NAD(P)(+)--arginine ADP-ribosyltransferase n=1 Tax=Haptolina ericina TaxID=156174 RepID=A0A7S3BDW3_9EUKA|mmetsp:Transcript_57746/g.128851  ORF Transcript_57746/g.128851 Transcript_57746/m.128851 type:complete len:145 (+) Transcript_57746:522-956(+)